MAANRPCWLAEPGVICALGAGTAQVRERLMAGDTGGLAPLSGWIMDRMPTLGAVSTPLPALPAELPAHLHSRNNRLLLAAALQIEAPLRAAVQRYGAARVAIVLGTSTSGVNDNAPAFGALARDGYWPADYDYRRQYLNAPAEFLAAWLGTTGPAYTLSTACTSSARALLSARRLLDLGLCDAVVCGGADTLCRLTINGFAALEAISDAHCLPFSANRRGINIGEAGVLFLMERTPADPAGIALLGGAGSSDAWHMSAPDPSGAGARQAMLGALADAGVDAADIGWVNLHGTATELNDAMESHAMHAVFPAGVPCASTKGLTGHALGAAGALEAALCWMALSPANTDGRLPTHVWDGVPDPALPALDFCTGAQSFAAGRPRIAMSNSFAFGGNNASLILGTHA
ncbi:beta-ketoacyl-[acyl-carrier-protein] synthase family protein [Pseudothauera rhizosphaerae]|uniref:Beta-ketoacyl-[acyl-carrier-protein] synthase family protein n=1 Tax=Pseudothauera rhizosphaerae TaxID=2565932 RepID=A0A4S4AVD4_9RHOO|nr:beta-ketoacyl-[acyl-carrier-protein] synthase family protein [Pseudothauera rhizosphaerae]THF62496.1 beta-ketoacyl-[acyl-carrier-protein] synthase family protein [Pseudothauera rhizosphaerae]